MRRALPTLVLLISFAAPAVLLAAPAWAQISSAPNTVPGTEANPFPVLNMPTLSERSSADGYRHLPSRDLGDAIRIQIAAGALYDFDRAQVPPRAGRGQRRRPCPDRPGDRLHRRTDVEALHAGDQARA